MHELNSVRAELGLVLLPFHLVTFFSVKSQLLIYFSTLKHADLGFGASPIRFGDPQFRFFPRDSQHLCDSRSCGWLGCKMSGGFGGSGSELDLTDLIQ